MPWVPIMDCMEQQGTACLCLEHPKWCWQAARGAECLASNPGEERKVIRQCCALSREPAVNHVRPVAFGKEPCGSCSHQPTVMAVSSPGLQWGLLCWSQQCWGCGLGEERGRDPLGPSLGFPVTFQLSFSPPKTEEGGWLLPSCCCEAAPRVVLFHCPCSYRLARCPLGAVRHAPLS